MHRRGGDGVNKQQHNKITPLSRNRPFSAGLSLKEIMEICKYIADEYGKYLGENEI